MQDKQRKDLAPLFIRLAVLWVAAGALFKLFAGSPNDLPPMVKDFPLGADLTFKLAIAIELTITFAALLRPRTAWPAVIALFLVFEVILMMMTGESCGCFGSKITIPPMVMLGIDGALTIAILASKPWKSEAKPLAPIAAVIVTSMVAIAAPFLIIGSQEMPDLGSGEANVDAADVEDMRWVEFDMASWDGQMIYDIELAALLGSEIDALPIDATCVIYRRTCDHCATHLEELAMSDDGTRPFVLIRIPDDEGTTLVNTLPMGGHVTMLTLPEGPAYLLETPAGFELEGAIIQSAVEGIEVDEH
jgi:hypothetical protein